MTKRRKISLKSKILAMFLLGGGLILVGVTALIAWPKSEPIDSGPLISSSMAVPVEVNYKSPTLTLFDLNDGEHSLSDYHGQVVLVNLWATWCPPCKAEMPILKAYYEAHQTDGFVTIAINDGDPKDDVVNFVSDYGLTFPVWLDPTYEATERAFKTLNLPSTFVIDREGNIRLRWIGEIDEAALDEYVTPLILE